MSSERAIWHAGITPHALLDRVPVRGAVGTPGGRQWTRMWGLGAIQVARERRAWRRAVPAGGQCKILEAFSLEDRHPVREVVETAAQPFTRWAHYPPREV